MNDTLSSQALENLAGAPGPSQGKAPSNLEPGIGESLADIFSFDHLLGVALWIALLWLLVRLYVWVARLNAAGADPERGEAMLKLVPTIRLVAWILGVLVVTAAVTPEHSEAKGVVFGMLLLLVVWIGHAPLRNLSAGVIIRMTRSIHEGQHVRIGELEGRVRSVGLRGIVLERRDGSHTLVPNSVIHTTATTFAPSPGAASPVEVQVTLPPEIRGVPPEVLRRIGRQMGLLSPRRAETPVSVSLDATCSSLCLRVTPFDASESDALQDELGQRLRAAFEHLSRDQVHQELT